MRAGRIIFTLIEAPPFPPGTRSQIAGDCLEPYRISAGADDGATRAGPAWSTRAAPRQAP